jgi:UDP-2,3-diacylglucosamine hydrolase
MGLAALPTFETIQAPPSWRCIDFISDLHLHEDLPRTTAALGRYLSETPADALFILGDLFEAWVGDDMRHQTYEASCMAMLAHAGQKLHLGIMVGNRDFLLGQAALAACHAHALPDPCVLQAFGRRALLTHGDALCLADTKYLAFRAQVRQPGWQQGFLAAPLTARLEQARQMRAASKQHQQGMPAEAWADVDEPSAAQWLEATDCQVLIHGHTHQPTTEPFGPPGVQRIVLSDWDLDHGATGRAQVLRLSAPGYERIDITKAL